MQLSLLHYYNSHQDSRAGHKRAAKWVGSGTKRDFMHMPTTHPLCTQPALTHSGTCTEFLAINKNFCYNYPLSSTLSTLICCSSKLWFAQHMLMFQRSVAKKRRCSVVLLPLFFVLLFSQYKPMEVRGQGQEQDSFICAHVLVGQGNLPLNSRLQFPHILNSGLLFPGDKVYI